MGHSDFDGIFKLIWAIVAIVGAVAAKKKAGQAKAARGEPSPVAEAERTRRVREEVARKIAARQRQDAGDRLARLGVPPPPQPKPVAAPAPVFPSDLYEWSGSARREDEALTAPVRSEESRLAEEVRAMQAAQAAPERASTPYTPPVMPATPESPWFTELRQPGGVRRAIVLREILGPPLALR
ncbi:MAG TPA: hypothetical protein VHV47_14900 [Opitutaceae bacterium]|jgi:type IV secretory pathway VirB10-like protein|nr:hypothetical protein [Opitutaceae bacterium]